MQSTTRFVRVKVAVCIAVLMAAVVGFIMPAYATVPAETRDKADGNVTEFLAPSSTAHGVEGVYLGNWENIGENDVMLLGTIRYANATIEVNDPNDIVSQSSDSALTTNLNVYENPLVITVPDNPAWTDPVAADATYTEENKDGSTSTYQGREMAITGATATLTWENAAVLKDGTICDLQMTISNITARLNPGMTYVAGDIAAFLSGSGNNGGLAAHSNFRPSESRDNTDPNSYSGEWSPGIGFDVTVKVLPQDGSKATEHDANQMIYYFTDLDANDRGISGDPADLNTSQTRFKGAYAESIQLQDGIKGPVIIQDKTYSDLETYETAGDGNSPTTSHVLYLQNATTPDPQGRLFNTERMEYSQGTWFSATHNTRNVPDKKYSGFVTLVNPDGFTMRWRGDHCGSDLLAQSDFEPILRVVNNGRYPNTLITTDYTDGVETGAGINPNGMDYVVRQHPTNYVEGLSTTMQYPDGNSNRYQMLSYCRYYVPWKHQKHIVVESKEGYHLTEFSVSDNYTNNSEKNQGIVDVEAMAIGDTAEIPGHAGMYVEKISASKAIVYLNEPYTEIGETETSGYLTNHTLRVASAPSVLTVHKRWIGAEEDQTSFMLDVHTSDQANANPHQRATVEISDELIGTTDPASGVTLVEKNGDIWTINYPLAGVEQDAAGHTWPALPSTSEGSAIGSDNARNLGGCFYFASESSVASEADAVWNPAGVLGYHKTPTYTNSKVWQREYGRNMSRMANGAHFGTYGDDDFPGGYINNVELQNLVVTKEWDDDSTLSADKKKELLEDNLTLSYEIGDDVTTEFQLAYEKELLTGDMAEIFTHESIVGNPDAVTAEPIINSDSSEISYKNLPQYKITFKGNAATEGSSTLPGYENIWFLIEKIEKINWYVTETQLEGFEAPKYTNTGDYADKTDAAYDGGTIANSMNPPTGEDDETWGLKGQPQTGEPVFTPGTAALDKVQLVDPETGEPTDATTIPAYDAQGNECGTYTLDPATGKVTFAPNADFVGDPVPAQLIATDKNGLTATANYQPHVIDDTETDTVSRTIHYIYSADGSEASADVTQTATFTRKATGIDPETHEPIWGGWELTDNQLISVTSPEIEGWTPSDEVVPGFDTLTYDQIDEVKDITVVYSPEPPEGNHKATFGPKGATQKGTPPFTEGTGKIEKYELIDGDGKVVDTLPAYDSNGKQVGAYTINTATGEVTYTPTDPEFVGTPTPATVRATDEYGETATGTYAPTSIDNTETTTVTKTIKHVYDDGSPVLDANGNPLVEEKVLTFTREGTVDPETGSITWPSWTEQTFENWDAPKIPGYTPSKKQSTGETVTPADGDITDTIIYKKDAYKVTYANGDHGASDGKGNQSGEGYGNAVAGGNGVTPDKGYKFTGKYTYVITDNEGNVIGEGETDDPTSIPITGNIVFTPVYEPEHYTIKYDANGGSGVMDPQELSGADGKAVSKANEFTRDGYTFVGFKALLPDGTYLKDENGNDLVFTDVKDFFDYLAEYGDGAEITLVAQWEPVGSPEPESKPEPKPSGGKTNPAPKAKPAPAPATGAKGMLARTADEAPLGVLAGVGLLALGAAAFARRRTEGGSQA